VRRAVVEHQDSLGERHRACRPGDQHGRGGHREQPQQVQQHSDVAAGDDQCGRCGEDMGQVGAVLDQHRALRGLRDGLEGRPGLAHPDQVPVVNEPDDGLGVRPCCGPYPVVTDVARHLAQRAQGTVELDRVQLSLLAPHGAVFPLRSGIARVAGQDVLPALVQTQVGAAPAEQPVQLGVVGLALLPAGRDRRDRSRQVQRPGDGSQGGQALGTEDDGPHPAYTCTVRPTSSSMLRSTS
jgi:hypothetical protein